MAFSVWIDELEPSQGEQARKAQILSSQNGDTSTPNSPDVIIEEATIVGNQTWKVGDPCRAYYTGDGLEYEATILEMKMTEDGNSFVKVDILGYETVETVWLSDLIPSQGQAARDQQVAAVMATVAANEVVELTSENPQANQVQEEQVFGGIKIIFKYRKLK